MIGLNCLIDSIAANEHLCGNCTGIFKDQQTSLFSFSFKANLQIFGKPQFTTEELRWKKKVSWSMPGYICLYVYSRSRVIAVWGAGLARATIVLSSPISHAFFLSSISLSSLAIILLLHSTYLALNASLLLKCSLCLSICSRLLLHLVHHLLKGGRSHGVLAKHLIHHDLVQKLLLLLIWSSCHRLSIWWETRLIVETRLKLCHLRVGWKLGLM